MRWAIGRMAHHLFPIASGGTHPRIEADIILEPHVIQRQTLIVNLEVDSKLIERDVGSDIQPSPARHIMAYVEAMPVRAWASFIGAIRGGNAAIIFVIDSGRSRLIRGKPVAKVMGNTMNEFRSPRGTH